MLHTDTELHQAVEAAVRDIERRTDAEIVVVAAARSDRWDHLVERAATLSAAALLLVLMLAPWTVHPLSAAAETAATWWVARWAFRHPPLLARLIPEARAREVVARAADAEFVREAVHATPGRTGVLVYLSALEGRVEVRPDLGVQGRVPAGELVPAAEALRADAPEAFLAGLAALGDVLARHLPHHGSSDETDLPNAPRIRA